nr:TetR family transcriptional regulator [Micromonospora sp. DSM 115978]
MAGAVGDLAPEDLTARARIREAALRLFAERGIDRVSVRDIARAAGVSAGLIRHHFSSKEGLRDACDTYALERLMRIKEQAVVEGRLADPRFLPSVEPVKLLLNRYLGRAMIDGSKAAAAMFDHLVDITERYLRENDPDPPEDTRAFATVFVGMQTGLLVMYDHMHRALGTDVASAEGTARIGRGVVDFYSRVMLSPELAARARAAYDELLHSQRPLEPAESRSAEEGAQR